MGTLYKLTDKDRKTYGNTLWNIDVPITAQSGVPVMCSSTVIHAYESPLIAAMLGVIHTNFGDKYLLWEAEGEVVIYDGLKVGCKSLTIKKQIEKPIITPNQYVAFAILSSLEVYSKENYVKWANNWLNSVDRTADTANVVSAAANVISAAAYAADAAAYAAKAANAAYVANVAVNAANAVNIAAYANNKKINFIELAEKAMNYA